jgi:ribonuclease PH
VTTCGEMDALVDLAFKRIKELADLQRHVLAPTM